MFQLKNSSRFALEPSCLFAGVVWNWKCMSVVGCLKLIFSNFFRQRKLVPSTTWQQTRLKQISKQTTSSLNWKQKLRRTVASQPQGKLEGMYFCTLYIV